LNRDFSIDFPHLNPGRYLKYWTEKEEFHLTEQFQRKYYFSKVEK